MRLAVAESVLHDVLSRELWGYLRKNANLRVALAELREGWPESAGPAEIAIWIADPGQPHPAMEGHFAAPARIAELGTSRTSASAIRASARGRPARTSWTTTCWRSSMVTPPAPPWRPGTGGWRLASRE